MTKLFEAVPKVLQFELNFGNLSQNIPINEGTNTTCKQDPKK